MFNCFHRRDAHNEQHLSLLSPTWQLPCRHLTLSVPYVTDRAAPFGTR